MKNKSFMWEAMIKVALPVTLQNLFQASFSVVDQIMAGQLGTVNVAGIGLGGKFAGLFFVITAAIATAAGILISQYVGNAGENTASPETAGQNGGDKASTDAFCGVNKSFSSNLVIMGIVAGIFTIAGTCFPSVIMSVYSKDAQTIAAAAVYLRILSIGFIPMALSSLLSTLLRCHSHAKFPMYASIFSAVVNTGLNYVLIFGKAGAPAMGVAGAAWASTLARIAECLILLVFLLYVTQKRILFIGFNWDITAADRKKLLAILLPIFVCEFLWSLGENVYAVVYGRMGTDACAAMTLTNPVQSLMIGALTGISSAAGILIGKKLGEGDEKGAYDGSKVFLRYGFCISAILSVVLLFTCGWYVNIYQVEPEVKLLTRNILIAYAFVAPVKVENMILGGGIIRSGGKTNYVMVIDMIGTWCVGVPLAVLCGIVLGLPIYWTYFIISMEECVRLVISIVVFRRKKWMQNLT